jgi:hypothetical protein
MRLAMNVVNCDKVRKVRDINQINITGRRYAAQTTHVISHYKQDAATRLIMVDDPVIPTNRPPLRG